METDNSKSLPAQPLWVGMWFPKASSGRVASEVVGSGFGTPGESASHHMNPEAQKIARESSGVLLLTPGPIAPASAMGRHLADFASVVPAVPVGSRDRGWCLNLRGNSS